MMERSFHQGSVLTDKSSSVPDMVLYMSYWFKGTELPLPAWSAWERGLAMVSQI